MFVGCGLAILPSLHCKTTSVTIIHSMHVEQLLSDCAPSFSPALSFISTSFSNLPLNPSLSRTFPCFVKAATLCITSPNLLLAQLRHIFLPHSTTFNITLHTPNTLPKLLDPNNSSMAGLGAWPCDRQLVATGEDGILALLPEHCKCIYILVR